MAEPLITVIIPTCGRVQFLGQAIESALAQGYGRPEVVVVDDGATDGSAEAAAAFPGVLVLRQGKRTGISAARNRALAESRGELVVFLDDDDRLLPDAFELGTSALLARPDAAMTFGRARVIRADGAFNYETAPQRSETFADVLRGGYPVHPAAAMARRSAVTAVGAFDLRRGIAQDYDFWTRLARRFPVHAHPGLVSEYRKHEGNVYKTRGPTACLEAVLSILESHRGLLRDDDERRAYQEARAHWLKLFGDALPWEVVQRVRQGQLRDAGSALSATLRHGPPGTLKRFGALALGRLSGKRRTA